MANLNTDEDTDPGELMPGGNDIFDPDQMDGEAKPPEPEQPLYQIYEGSRIAVSKSVGPAHRQKFDATAATYAILHEHWNEAYKYYNNTQQKGMQTPRGVFKRGDSTENLVYSNINVLLPAVYGQDPDITINTTDENDTEFVNTLKTLSNAVLRRKQLLNAKPKIRRAVGFALLTNCGILKIDYTLKDDSRQHAQQELQELTDQLATAKDTTEVERIYGRIEALEATMEVRQNSGPTLGSVMPQNLWCDPYAELPDASDGSFMVEKVYLQTSYLNARFTKKDEDGNTVLVYKPTHKVSFTAENGTREDGLGMVLDAISGAEAVTENEDQKRAGYRGMYYTECYYYWDKPTRRIFLYQRDDWTWPIWVWDDRLKLSRFYPYFVMAFGMSTGGSASVGEVSYYLDQQDEVNDINRKVARIRRTIFDYFYYDSNGTDKDEMEKFSEGLRGETANTIKLIGIKVPEGKKLRDMFDTVAAPDENTQAFFKKEPTIDSINRISNTSDALRGVQFKTNTNEAAVQSYQDATRMAVGAKMDVVEDTVADVVQALCELMIQFMSAEEVAGIIGLEPALGWQNMDTESFNAQYSMEIVAGSTEKPNSAFKKKEAIQIGQMLGQFSSAAPLSSLKILLRVMQNAFSEVVIKPEDWQMLDREAEASMRQGDSTGGAGAPGAGGPQTPAQAGAPAQAQAGLAAAAMRLPPEAKQKILQAKAQGVPPDQLKQMLMQAVQGGGGQGPQPQGGVPAPQPQQPLH